MSDLVKKLRSYPSSTCKDADIYAAADRIEELEASIDKNDEWAKWFIEKTDTRIAELEAALQPFAELGDNFSDSEVMESIRHARKVIGEKE